jgi:hypothetical protein
LRKYKSKMDRQELIEKMVNNYYKQSKGRNSEDYTLEQYLKEIMFMNREIEGMENAIRFTPDDLKYGLSLKRQ